MKNIEWQPHVDLFQTGTAAATDITQEDDFWLDVTGYTNAVLTIEVLYASDNGTPDLVIETSDDPSTGLWATTWQRSRYDPSHEEGRYLVTLSRQVAVGKYLHLGTALRWRATGFSTSADTEIAFRILATLQ